MSKLSNDPTQSLWLENKRAKEYIAAFDEFNAGLIKIATDNITDPAKIKELQTAYETDQIENVFRPLSTKYTKMALMQGKKFADLQLKAHGKKTK